MKTKEYLKWLGIAFSLFLFLPALSQGQSRPNPLGDRQVGKLVRPLELAEVGTLFWQIWSQLGSALMHHDVVVKPNRYNLGEWRGFFADDFKAAAEAYLKYQIPFSLVDGYVSGTVAKRTPYGEEHNVNNVNADRYFQVRERILTSTSNRYHLAKFNCQTWASEQLEP